VNLSLLIPLLAGVPFAAFLGLGAWLLLGGPRAESKVNTLANLVILFHVMASTVLGIAFLRGVPLAITLGSWYHAGNYEFELDFFLDALGVAYLVSSSLICAVGGYFSERYLHRDPGYYRFFILFFLFLTGISLVVTAAHVDLFLVGWEFIGITSVLLIGFFQYRTEPTKNSLYTLIIYKCCDIALLTAAIYWHALSEHHDLPSTFEGLTTFTGAVDPKFFILGALVGIAALGKSAQLPFSGWLPRAMEGPTPSTALFYGAISIHLGAFLLLRTVPLWKNAPGVDVAILIIGLSTAAYGSFVGRTRSDAKTQLAYAAVAQLGVIFFEIGLGLYILAALHFVGHSFLRTYQFLKSPSLMQELGQLHSERRRQRVTVSSLWLFRLSLSEGHLHGWIDYLIAKPVQRILGKLDAAEKKWAAAFDRMYK